MQINQLRGIKNFDLNLPKVSECQLKASKLKLDTYELPPEVTPKVIANKLIKEGLASLTPRDQRNLPLYILNEAFDEFNPDFTKQALKQVEPDGRFVNRLFGAWIFDYQPETKNGAMVKNFLKKNKKYLQSEEIRIDEKFKIISGLNANDQVIKSFIDGSLPERDLDYIGISLTRQTSTNYSTFFLLKICMYIKNSTLDENQIKNVIDFFTYDELVNDSIKSFALFSLINSLNSNQVDLNNDVQKRVVDIIQNSFGDPRIPKNLGRWPSFSELIGGDKELSICVEVVKKWLNLRSIELFFDIIERVEVSQNDRHMFPARRRFWTSIINNDVVSEITVILSRKGVEIAENLSIRDPNISKLEWGKSRESERCTLLLRIGELTIMDWSHVGAIRIYDASNPRGPQLNQKVYSKDQLNVDDDFGGSANWGWISHDPSGNWRSKVERMIKDHSGMRIRL